MVPLRATRPKVGNDFLGADGEIPGRVPVHGLVFPRRIVFHALHPFVVLVVVEPDRWNEETGGWGGSAASAGSPRIMRMYRNGGSLLILLQIIDYRSRIVPSPGDSVKKNGGSSQPPMVVGTDLREQERFQGVLTPRDRFG